MRRFAATLFPGLTPLSQPIRTRGGRAGDSGLVRAVVHSPAPLSAQEVANMEPTLASVPGRLRPELPVGGQNEKNRLGHAD